MLESHAKWACSNCGNSWVDQASYNSALFAAQVITCTKCGITKLAAFFKLEEVMMPE